MSVNGKAIRKTLTPKFSYPLTTFPTDFTEIYNIGSAADTKFQFDTKTIIDRKESAESQISTYLDKTKLLNPKQLLESLDAKTAAMLNTACCTTAQTTQFWHYLIGKACLSDSGCAVAGEPERGGGGWHHTEFLTLYIRALLETMARIKRKEDRSLQNDLPLLKKELMIAKACYQSAVHINTIDNAFRKLDIASKQQAYAVALKERTDRFNALQQLTTRLQTANTSLVSVRTENAAFVDRYNPLIKEYRALKAAIEHFEAHVRENNLALFPQTQAKYLAGRNRLNELQIQINKLVADFNSLPTRHQNLTAEIAQLNSQIDMVRTALQNKNTALLTAHSTLQQAQQLLLAFETAAENNLLHQLNRLKIGETHCQAAGFIGHAIYINFKKLKNGFEVKICNDGLASGTENHPHLITNSDLVLPAIINFSKDAKSKKELDLFCSNIIKAITKTKDEAVALIYQHGLGTKLTATETNALWPTLISAEMPQSIANCTEKGYFHALRERLLNRDLYQNLMLSLLVWSKNADFYRNHLANQANTLPQDTQSLITDKELELLRNEESAFIGVRNTNFRQHMKQNFIAGLMFAKPKAVQTTPVMQPVMHFATASPSIYPSHIPFVPLARPKTYRTNDYREDNSSYSPNSSSYMEMPSAYEAYSTESRPAPIAPGFSNYKARHHQSHSHAFQDSTVNASHYSENSLERILRPYSPNL